MKLISVTLSTAFVIGSTLCYAQAELQGNASGQSNTSVSAQRNSASANNSSGGSAQTGTQSGKGQVGSQASGQGEFGATLSKPVDARKAKPGDEVTATSTQDYKSNGEVIVPRGSKLIGHVTSAQPRGSERHPSSESKEGGKHDDAGVGAASKAQSAGESELGIVFDRAILKHAGEVPINATVAAIASGEAAASAATDDTSMAMSGAGQAAAMGRAGGGGLLGAVGGTTRGAVGGLSSTAGAVGGSMGSSLGSSPALGIRSPGAIGGLDSAGRLQSGSHGVFGLKGLNLISTGSGSAQGTLITSSTHDVRLDPGTQMLLSTSTQSAASAAAQGASETSGGASKGSPQSSTAPADGARKTPDRNGPSERK